jgi:flagellar protein FlgJ
MWKLLISIVSALFTVKVHAQSVTNDRPEYIPMKKIITHSQLPHVRAFISSLSPLALTVENETGIRALAMLGQVALETGWGKSVLRADVNGVRICTNNLFNIKAHDDWTGQVGTREVWEVINGKDVTVPAQFRVYPNYEESFRDYVQYINTRRRKDGTLRYEKALAVKDNWEAYLMEIAAAGYATAPTYARDAIMCVKNYMIEVTE